MKIRNRATLIVKTKNGILVGKPWFIWSYRLIGGGVKFRESYEEAALRELKEETGVEIKKIKYLFDFKYGLEEHKAYFTEIKNEEDIKMNWENKNVKYVDKVNFMKNELNGFSKKILAKYFGLRS